MITLEHICSDIAQWHLSTFPETQLADQLLKLDEECREAIETDFNDILELADVFIVSATLWKRFNAPIGMAFIQLMTGRENFHLLIKAVEDKMKINRNRVWKKVNNIYRHQEQ